MLTGVKNGLYMLVGLTNSVVPSLMVYHESLLQNMFRIHIAIILIPTGAYPMLRQTQSINSSIVETNPIN